MATGIFGYFRFTINDVNLSGDYMNWLTQGLQHENGDKLRGIADTFEGDYETRWTDEEDRVSNLVIERAEHGTFLLNWNVTSIPGRGTSFRGRGVINERKELLGFYEMLP